MVAGVHNEHGHRAIDKKGMGMSLTSEAVRLLGAMGLTTEQIIAVSEANRPKTGQLEFFGNEPVVDDVKAAIDAYNATAKALNLPQVVKLTDLRRTKLKARLKEVGPDGWSLAMQRLTESAHCQGRNDRGWKADLDFLLSPQKLTRLLEGSYAGKANGNGTNNEPAWQEQRRRDLQMLDAASHAAIGLRNGRS